MSGFLKRRWWLVPGIAIALAVVGFVAWASLVPAPMEQTIAALESDTQVQVDDGVWLVFRPEETVPVAGLILYPGGRVDPRAYAPLARDIAQQDYLVVIVPMPLHLAVFGAEKAGAVIAHYDQVRHWAIGGHSLGGAMAARYAHAYPEQIAGLVLWASYPADSNDLSARDLPVVSVYGTRDGLATIDKIEASRTLLPDTTTWVAIEGGNHAQFGWYGSQSGDNAATINREAQQAQIVAATCELLESLR
ncbi:MAG: alpha/beta hydrolase [Anaerolineae bacterium]|nr:alpha/beta hydrolase [Anaerolineae bacterium]